MTLLQNMYIRNWMPSSGVEAGCKQYNISNCSWHMIIQTYTLSQGKELEGRGRGQRPQARSRWRSLVLVTRDTAFHLLTHPRRLLLQPRTMNLPQLQSQISPSVFKLCQWRQESAPLAGWSRKSKKLFLHQRPVPDKQIACLVRERETETERERGREKEGSEKEWALAACQGLALSTLLKAWRAI